MKRRQFIRNSGTVISGVLGASVLAPHGTSAAQEYPKRPLGNTGESLSIIGFGGIVVRDSEQAHANRVVAESVEMGINYFDVAPSYGNAEEKLGPALEPHRDKVFLACKTGRRDAKGAEEELQASLKKLRTDRFDLYQLHALSKMEDLEQVFALGGAMELFEKAKEKGLVRFLGFSAHSAEVAVAAMERFDFDTILFPFNYVTWHEGGFGPQVLEKAKSKNVARLALKAMAMTTRKPGQPRDAYKKCWYVPVTDEKTSELAVRFTLSLDITSAVPPGEEVLYRRALAIARDAKPLTESEAVEIAGLAEGVEPIFRA
jgi:predicted aldo/keto reductase-like oxidoreductase